MRITRFIIALFISDCLIPTTPVSAAEVLQPAMNLPLLHEVDVVVIGGNSGAVAAAVAAAESGASVFLAAPKTYLGDDLAGTYQLWLEPGEKADGTLAREVFSKEGLITPMQSKRVLDQALVKAGVRFLFGSYATDLLRDASGNPAGVVIANRSGRQAVVAKVIIDATNRASVARLAGAEATPFPSGNHVFTRVMVGGTPPSAQTPITAPFEVDGGTLGHYPVLKYSLTLPMTDGSFASFAEAAHIARDCTWSNDVKDASDDLGFIPPDRIRGMSQHQAAWTGIEGLPLDVFRPAGVSRLYVLGGCADVDRNTAAALLRPVSAMSMGTRLGLAAATEAKATDSPVGVTIPAGLRSADVRPGQVRDIPANAPTRGNTTRTIPAAEQAVPVLGEYDVVVAGGGTGGASAAIAAGRAGAKVLMIEYLTGMGGVGTKGLISVYFFGNRVGFTNEIDRAMMAIDPESLKTKGERWDPELKAEWLRQEARKAGVTLWFATAGIGAVVENGTVRGVEVATTHGRGVVLAKKVIDATGAADIAAAAGAPCTVTNADEIAVQGTGMPPRKFGARFLNTDFTYVDETDILDIWRVLVTSREKYAKAYDLGQLIDTRERRRIVGELELTPMDAMTSRTWPDTIFIASSKFDSHGYTTDPLSQLRPPDPKNAVTVAVPYRCMLPKGLDGLIVIGVGMSVHRDALPIVRMQADIQNQGYAMGLAAATLAKNGKAVRELDVKALQRQLVEKGNLPESVLSDSDSFPLPPERLSEAVKTVTDNGKNLEVLLAQPEAAKPLLRQALDSSKGAEKVIYARILGMLGDPAATEVLIQAVNSAQWDKGWNFKGMGQFGANLSQLDCTIMALGHTRQKVAVAPILSKAAELTPASDFSHFRAVFVALESIRDPSAAKSLAALLALPGISGNAETSIQESFAKIMPSGTDESTRRRELIEMGLARALYRCGDFQGMGEQILRNYARDLRGHYARHAQAILDEKR
ncbi:MAG: FAD-dependent oxidoreductase [Verrucomicrobiota bacterium]